MKNYIQPTWPAPKNIRAYTTTRNGGVSKPPYASLNFSTRTGDDLLAVNANREQLKHDLKLPSDPCWLGQEHTNIVFCANANNGSAHLVEPIADASFTTQPSIVCAIQTADCLPILLCDCSGTAVATVHAGWRGMTVGIIEETIKAMKIPSTQLLAWLGPAIGPNVYEVGNEVRDIFIQKDPQARFAFKQCQGGWLANIYLLGRQHLQNCGVTAIYGGEFCTFSQSDLFYSFRRNGAKSGRMASLIWFDKIK